jgi:hypothetical protein
MRADRAHASRCLRRSRSVQPRRCNAAPSGGSITDTRVDAFIHSVNPDPPPVKPEKPLASDCCESGCDRCVFDVYAEALAHYEAALAAWRARHPDAAAATDRD